MSFTSLFGSIFISLVSMEHETVLPPDSMSHPFLRFILHFKHKASFPTPPQNVIPSCLPSLQEKSSKGSDNQLAVPPLSMDGSKSHRSKLVFEDR